MKGAIFFTGKFGSTRQYAQWIKEATGFPVFELNKESPDPENYDLLILGSSIIVMKPTIRKKLLTLWPKIKEKPLLLFTVSGTKPGHPDLQKWLDYSLPKKMIQRMKYVPLRGRLNLKELPWWPRLLMKFAAWMEKDPDTKKRMEEGFDYMDRSSIDPILKWIEEIQNKVLTEA